MSEQVFLPGIPVQVKCDALERLEGEHHWTLSRLRERRPGVLEALVEMLRTGMTVRKICEALEVAPGTVVEARRQFPDAVETAKEHVAEKSRLVAELAADLAAERLASGDARTARDAMVSHGIAVQNWQLLSGGATSRSQSLSVSLDASDWNDWINSRRESPAQREAEPGPVLEVSESTGLAASDCASVGGHCVSEPCDAIGGGCIPATASLCSGTSLKEGGGDRP